MQASTMIKALLSLLALASRPSSISAQDTGIAPPEQADDDPRHHWPPASSARATVQDLHNEYRNIFRHGNRNAASHRWATFLLDRSHRMTEDRLAMFFGGFCAVSGSPVRPSDYNRYRLTLPRVGGGHSTGYMHYCCWPCVCDTQDYVRVDTRNVTLADGAGRGFRFAVIGNPCDDPGRMADRFAQPFDGRMTSIADSAREVRCLPDGSLEGATLSDGGYVIVGMFFDSQDAVVDGTDGTARGAREELADPTPGRTSAAVRADRTGRRRYQDEREYGRACEERARNGYNSGMGEIFRRVCAVSPISQEALQGSALDGADTDDANSSSAGIDASSSCELDVRPGLAVE